MSTKPEIRTMPSTQIRIKGFDLARDMLPALCLAVFAGLGTALASGLLVLLLAGGAA